jgi:hypothetical protein
MVTGRQRVRRRRCQKGHQMAGKRFENIVII